MASRVSYKINLNRLVKRTYADKDASFRRRAREIVRRPEFRRAYGLAVINKISENTEAGKDKRGVTISSYAPYKKSYRKSLEFKVYGKTSRVNLTLSGEMLASMAPLEKGSSDIEIYFVDKTNNDKAHGHINGSFSKKGKRKLPQRDFFGLPPKQEEAILKQLMSGQAEVSILNLVAETSTLLEAFGGEDEISFEDIGGENGSES